MRGFGKRFFVAAVMMAPTFGGAAIAQTPPPVRVAADSFLDIATYRLWSGRAPEAQGDGADETPTISVLAPHPGRANGTAVVIAPGGAYVGLAASLEGRQVADWFASRGVTAFVLKYRVGPRARLPIPLLDGARAMRLVRANAAFFGVDPKRIGMMGFSAGGHLSATTAAEASTGDPRAADPVDRASSRPDFLILGYPWLEGMAIDPRTGKSQYCSFARTDCDSARYARYLPVQSVTAKMPPTFLYHTTDDELVPVEGSVRFYQALKAKGVPIEMHLFAHGPHGTGLGGSDPALDRWPELLEGWLRGLGLLPAPVERK